MNNLFKALATFQQAVPAIHKGTEGYGYSYADLAAIFEVINPLLKENGLGFTQLLDDKKIKTIIFHCESGETIESTVTIPDNVVLKGMNAFQVTGSAITYYRRYSLSAILGLVTDKDTDGAGKKELETQAKQPVNKPAKQAPKKKTLPALTQNHSSWPDVLKAVKSGKADVTRLRMSFVISKELEDIINELHEEAIEAMSNNKNQ